MSDVPRVQIVLALTDEPLSPEALAVSCQRDLAEIRFHVCALRGLDVVEDCEPAWAGPGWDALRLTRRGRMMLQAFSLLGLPDVAGA
jgi:hypothetical protein